MKLIKKSIIGLLTALILVTTCNYQKIDAQMSTQEVSTATNNIADTATRAAQIAQSFSMTTVAQNKFIYGGHFASGVMGVANLSLSILKQAGVFGKSAEQIQREQLNNRLNAIDSSLDSINITLQSNQQQLFDYLKEIETEISNISVTNDKNHITSVDKLATEILTARDTFLTNVNQYLQEWYYDSSYTYSSDRLVVNYQKSNLTDAGTIVIPKTIAQSSVASINISTPWDIDEKENVIKGAFKIIAEKMGNQNPIATDFEEFVSSVYEGETWETISIDSTKKNNVLDKFAEAGYNSLTYDCAKQVLTATYVNELLNKFIEYCNYLSEKDSTYISPLASQYDIYSTMYVFQSDLNCTYTTDEEQTIQSNLAEMTMQKYFTQLNDIGSFIALAAEASGTYTKNDLNSQIYNRWAATEKKIMDCFNNFYHYDYKNGISIDNYCYVTKSVVCFTETYLTCKTATRYKSYKDILGTSIRKNNDHEMRENWSIDVNNSLLLGTTDLQRIYYRAKTMDSSKSFKNFILSEYNDKGNKELFGIKDYVEEFDTYPTKIITKFIGSNNFGSGDSFQMFNTNLHDHPGKFGGFGVEKGSLTSVSANTDDFSLRVKAVADTFDMKDGTSINSDSIGAVATYQKDNTYKDNASVFWDENYYNNVENLTLDNSKLIEIGTKEQENFYSKEYIGSDCYECLLAYCRKYGAFVSMPVKDYVSMLLQITVESNRKTSYRGDVLKKIMPSQKQIIPQKSTPIIVPGIIQRGLPIVNSLNNSFSNNVNSSRNEFASSISDLNLQNVDDTYAILFNQSNSSKDDNTCCTELFAFINSNISELTGIYHNVLEKTSAIVDFENNETSIELTNEQYKDIVKGILTNLYNCDISDTVPTSQEYSDDFIYCISDENVYKWDGNVYTLYNTKANFVSEKGITITGDVPSLNATEIDIKYNVKPLVLFNFYYDNNENINYDVYYIYDVIPKLVWEESGSTKTREINNEALQEAVLERMEIRIPIININGSSDNTAVINHYYSFGTLEQPIEKFNVPIKDENGVKYGIIKMNSFSPVMVEKTYQNISTSKYKFPVTGIK